MPRSKRGRPAFVLSDSDQDASRSRDRVPTTTGDLEAQTTPTASSSTTRRDRSISPSQKPSLTSSRKQSFGSYSPSRPRIPHEIVEGEVWDGNNDSANESDALLSRSFHSGTPSSHGKRPHRISTNSYGATGSGGNGVVAEPGTFEDGMGNRFVQLNAGSGTEGGIKRHESILKLSGLINDRGGEYEKYRTSDEDLRLIKNKGVRDYYEELNAILDGFVEVDEILDNTQAKATTGELAPMYPDKPSTGREEAFNSLVQRMITINLLVNIVLLGGKIAIVLLSNSMSLVASTVDSAMDFLSTVIIFGMARVVEKKDWKSRYNWPTGKKRLEPMGVVIFSVAMISSFLQVLIESLNRLFSPDAPPAEIPIIGGVVMVATIAIKLVIWFWCRTTKNASVQALAQDAENDIVFNFFSLVFPFVGQWLGWKVLDPLGGALLSLYIIIEWISTLLENVTKLTGKRAAPREHQRVAYLLTRFSPLITGIQHLSVYHAGEHFIVETDVVLPNTTALTVAHNLGESAQFGIEQLEGVERAFVHIDVSFNPLSGHLDR